MWDAWITFVKPWARRLIRSLESSFRVTFIMVWRSISQTTWISLINDLGKYLGVSLIHNRPTKATYDFILKKSQKRLSSWRASSLSLVGSINLAQSMISAFPLTVCRRCSYQWEIATSLISLKGGFYRDRKMGLRRWARWVGRWCVSLKMKVAWGLGGCMSSTKLWSWRRGEA